MESKINQKKLNFEVCPRIVDQVIKSCGHKRLKCVIVYGSILDTKELNPKDIDIFVLLDTYHTSDYLSISKIKKNVPTSSIFIDYFDWIKQRGLQNYQFGRHGVYFLKILSNGKCIYGKNEYKKFAKNLSIKKINSDLRYRIDEYFYRIYREIVGGNDILILKKYFCRIIIDLLLIERKLSFKDVACTSYLALISVHINCSSDNRNSLFDSILRLKSTSNYREVSRLIPKLYKCYLKTYN